MRRLCWSAGPCIGLILALGCSSSEEGGGAGNGSRSTGGSGPIFEPGAGTGSSGNLFTDGGELRDGVLENLRNSACAGDTRRTESLPSVIQFIVDTSGSMGRDAPGSNDSKWQVTRDALGAAIDSLPSSTAIGIQYYPNQGTSPSEPNGDETDPPRAVSECVNTSGAIPIDLLGPAGSAHRGAIASSLAAVDPEGGTPTHDAYHLALDPIRATQFPGSRFLVLITDGQPTFLSGCRGTGNISDAVDPRPIVDEVTGAAGEGFKTFVIGSPGSEEVGIPIFDDARTWLSMAASTGGTARPGCSDSGPQFCHFDMSQEADFAQALQTTLQLIVGAVLSCSYPVPTPTNGQSIDPDKVNVIYTPAGGASQLVPRAPVSGCGPGTEGWRYTDDGGSIELCETTCNRIKGSENPQLDVLFGCSSVIDVPR